MTLVGTRGKHRARLIGSLTLSVALAALSSAPHAWAQAGEHAGGSVGAGADRDDAPAEPGPMRERVRTFLTRTIETTKPRLERMEKALRLVNDGASLEQVRALFPEALRPERAGERGEWLNRLDRLGEPGGRRSGDDLNDPDMDGPGPRRDGPGPRGSRGRDDDEPGSSRASALTEDDKVFIREFLKASDPSLLPKLEELEKRDPDAVAKRYSEMWPRVRFLHEMRSRDPELYALRLQEITLGREAVDHAKWIVRWDHESKVNPPTTKDPKERSDREAKLRQVLSQQFQLRGKVMTYELSKLRERLDRGAKEIAERGKDESKVVDETMRTMLQRVKDRKNPMPGLGSGGGPAGGLGSGLGGGLGGDGLPNGPREGPRGRRERDGRDRDGRERDGQPPEHPRDESDRPPPPPPGDEGEPRE